MFFFVRCQIFQKKIVYLRRQIRILTIILFIRMKRNNSKRGPRRFGPDHIEVYRIDQPCQLLAFLMETLAPKSRTEIKSYLQHGNVMHNGQVTTQFDEQLQHDDELVINFTRPFATLKSRMARVIWEDDDIVVIEKKSGLLTVATGPMTRRSC